MTTANSQLVPSYQSTATPASGIRAAIIQTAAVFVDAYRELNSRKMFWIVLIISGLVVIAFAGVGIDEKGLYVFGFPLPIPFNTTIMPKADFYKMLFSSFGVGFWLAWLSTILALISTAGMFPDMLTGGSIDLYLSKPISRLRLFLTKYLSALLFVGLQVTVFTVASFFVMGIRAETWLWGLFLAIPVMLLFFSYLYSICTLVGIVTRSTLAALLLTLLAWFAIWIIHTTEASLLLFKLKNEQEMVMYDRQIAALDQRIARLQIASTQPTTGPTPVASSPATAPTTDESAASSNEGFLSRWAKAIIAQQEVSKPNEALSDAKRQLADVQKRRDEFSNPLVYWHRLAVTVKAVMPKTSETIELLNRGLAKYAGIQNQTDDGAMDDPMLTASTSSTSNTPGDREARRRNHQREELLMEQAQARMVAELHRRSLFWVVGTSLIFEAVLLSIAAFVFCRRDF